MKQLSSVNMRRTGGGVCVCAWRGHMNMLGTILMRLTNVPNDDIMES